MVRDYDKRDRPISCISVSCWLMEWWSVTSQTHTLRYGSERAQNARKRHLTVNAWEHTLHQKKWCNWEADADGKLLELALKVFFHRGFYHGHHLHAEILPTLQVYFALWPLLIVALIIYANIIPVLLFEGNQNILEMKINVCWCENMCNLSVIDKKRRT